MAEKAPPPSANQGPVVARVSRLIEASPEQVFDAWLDPSTAGKFLFATPRGEMVQVEIGARVGGKFVIVERRDGQDAAHYGEYIEIDRPRRIAFRFSTERQAPGDLVVVDIKPANGGSEVSLAHELKPEQANVKERTASGWKGILKKLGETLA